MEHIIITYLIGWIKGIAFLLWIPSIMGVEFSLQGKFLFSILLAWVILPQNIPENLPLLLLATQEAFYGMMIGILLCCLEKGLSQTGKWSQVPIYGIDKYFLLLGWIYLLSIQFPYFLFLALAKNPFSQGGIENIRALPLLFSKLFILAFTVAFPFLLAMTFYEVLKGLSTRIFLQDSSKWHKEGILPFLFAIILFLLAPFWIPHLLHTSLDQLVF
ncbi:MAG: hypothetical protein D6785_07260 [Planctomycetota bacterium]|nr:MAG: hypothetical protein D6785_07260 [Planctomycetota bacterium]